MQGWSWNNTTRGSGRVERETPSASGETGMDVGMLRHQTVRSGGHMYFQAREARLAEEISAIQRAATSFFSVSAPTQPKVLIGIP